VFAHWEQHSIPMAPDRRFVLARFQRLENVVASLEGKVPEARNQGFPQNEANRKTEAVEVGAEADIAWYASWAIRFEPHIFVVRISL